MTTEIKNIERKIKYINFMLKDKGIDKQIGFELGRLFYLNKGNDNEFVFHNASSIQELDAYLSAMNDTLFIFA